MITKYDVEMAYRLFLGRLPENNDVVKSYVNTCKEIDDLRDAFLGSEEFKPIVSALSKVSEPAYFCQMSGNESKIHVDVQLTTDVMDRLYKRVERIWTNLGQTEPHWAVLSAERFKSNKFQDSKNEFYLSGKREAKLLFDYANRNNVEIKREGKCLEFGCGVGRITRWLAEEFRNVVATDISESMLKLCGDYLNNVNMSNVTLHHLSALSSLTQHGKYDSAISFIVIQHNPPPVMLEIVRSLMVCLNPGGVALFQIPTYARGYAFEAISYLKNDISDSIEMHCLPQADILR